MQEPREPSSGRRAERGDPAEPPHAEPSDLRARVGDDVSPEELERLQRVDRLLRRSGLDWQERRD